MIVDSSAIVAIAADEPERGIFIRAILMADSRRLSAGTLIELSAVAIRQRSFTLEWLNRVIDVYRLSIEPVTIEQARVGQDAYRRFGIGSGERARLNFGDCFAYALAMATGEPLLFKGDDFTHTDVIRAI